MSENVVEQLDNIGILPVLTLDKASRAVPLAKALKEAGIPAMEVMFRSEDSAECIRRITAEVPDFTCGAGTVLTPEQARTAVKCGAKFLVAPGLDPEVVRAAKELGVPMIPGCTNPTEFGQARALGCKVIKFFPSIQNGGVKAMELIGGPFPDVRFVPTGDLLAPDAFEFLQFWKVAAAGGDYMLKYDDIHNDRYEKIRQDAENTVLSYLNFHIAHVGVNASTSEEAGRQARAFGAIFKAPVQEFGKSFMAGALFEAMKSPYYYEKGHIAVGTRDCRRAYWYLRRRGVEFIEDTVSHDDKGRITCAYLKEPLAGFAIHLLQD
ncbi:MAG: bifunctional 4-hydroxy-2-oxoglutarate aldolase/2-dehydro-3-deoxy-phosphogluconate aldolase [Succinivibrio sp.]